MKIISTGTPSSCGYVPALMGGGEEEMSSMSLSSGSSYTNELAFIANDNTTLPYYSDESHWLRKQYVFNALKNDPSLKNNNSTLTNFYNSTVNANIGKFSKVEDGIAIGNYGKANNLNNSINPNNIIEQNQKTVNALLLSKLMNNSYVYSQTDSIALYDIASQCPLSGGNSVYQARNMLMNITNELIDFENDCEEAERRFIADNENQSITENQKAVYKLYPNPNEGRMNFIYSLHESEKGELVIYDISGRVILSYKLQAGDNNQLFINESKLNNGVYFYEVLVNDKIELSDKLVIIK